MNPIVAGRYDFGTKWLGSGEVFLESFLLTRNMNHLNLF